MISRSKVRRMANAEAWLGIPYAEAQRFTRPFRLPWDGDLSRHGALGPSAPQLASNDIVPGMQVGPTDEAGCLTVNVWAPEEAASKPVLVWFHGGSFVIGSSAQRCHDGARLAAEQDVVVVSANYRLGRVGVPRHALRSGAMSPTSGCTTRSPRSNGSRTTSPRSAEIRRASPCSGCPRAVGSASTCSRRPRRPVRSPR